MTETLSIRLDSVTKQRLTALSRRSKRSESFLVAEAIAAFVEKEEGKLGEVNAVIEELDAGQSTSHQKVASWLKSWGLGAIEILRRQPHMGRAGRLARTR